MNIKNLLYMLPFYLMKPVFADGYAGGVFSNGTFTFTPPKGENKGFFDTVQGGYNGMSKLFTFIWAACIILAIISLVIGGVQLSMAAGNPQKTQKAWGRIKISLIVIACLGGLTTIITMALTLFVK